jgi:hypothetical protein
VQHLPEALLLFFVVSLLPLVVLGLAEALRVAGTIWQGPLAFARSVREEPGPAFAVFICLGGTVGVSILLWRNWARIWAVARKMILEALHRKVIIVLLIFFVVLMPSLPFVLETEGSLKSHVQIVLLYSLVLCLVLLSLVAIFAATASICTEVEGKYVHITDTKPLLRWQFLLGKWLGIVVMCTAILYGMAGGAYLLVQRLQRLPARARMAPKELEKAVRERLQVKAQVLVARKSVRAPMPDVSAEVEAEVERLRKLGRLSPYSNSFRQSYAETVRSQKLSVPAGSYHRWDFSGLDPNRGGSVYVRFKGYNPGGLGVYGAWVAFQREVVPPAAPGAQPEEKLLRVGEPVPAPADGWRNNTFQEFEMPASYIGKDGTLILAYANVDPRIYENPDPRLRMPVSVTFSATDPVEVLQAEEGFFRNYYRALLIILFHVSLLAALGLMAGSLFSFPVAALVVSCLFIGGLIGPWFAQFTQPDIYAKVTPVAERLQTIWRAFATGVLALMPNFASFSPLNDLVNGRMVTWNHVTMAGAALFFAKGGVALLIGMYFYGRRELARVIV